ncbi:MAG: right-handed parallel beta-helix repeat-containing protein [Erysipelotrichaceae bacterium]|nr:right-handed parallel beta-helix repeat-containing protein [Erysipelotrichaceae bacterium]
MIFTVASLGNARGRILRKEIEYPVSEHVPFDFEISSEADFQVLAESGKFSDTEDSFLFICTSIDPYSENCCLSADFQVAQTSPDHPGWLSGYGLLAADTAVSHSKTSLFRNSLAVGRFRTNTFHEFGCGLRIISGYDDPEAIVSSERKRDISRSTSAGFSEPVIQKGETYSFSLSKNDSGFTATIRHNGNTETLSFPGSDLLTVQDPEHIYVGLAIAGDLAVNISNLSYETGPGIISHTPGKVIHSSYTDYPFSASLFVEPEVKVLSFPETVYVSPNGRPDAAGSKKDPADLQTVLTACNVKKIILQDGTYRPTSSCYIGKENSGKTGRPKVLTAENSRRAAIDGSLIEQKTPALIVRGNYWEIHDIVFRNAPSSGLFLCGSHNVAENCEAFANNDTGFLICAYPGSLRDEWPESNLIAFCDSHDNHDLAETDADGFGAKLSVGEGNCLYECAAVNNADDGFDLFSKRTIGPTGSVTIENCVAAKNGSSGFKFGGENQPVKHELSNSLAFSNGRYGFTANSNPLSKLRNLISWNNGTSVSLDSYSLQARTVTEPKWICENLLPKGSELITTEERKVCSKELNTEQAGKTFRFFNTDSDIERSAKGLIKVGKILMLSDKLPSDFFSRENPIKRIKRLRRFRSLKSKIQN